MDVAHMPAKYRDLPTGNIADALIQLGYSGRVLHGLAPLVPGQQSYAGWAYTVQQRAKGNAEGPGHTRHAEVIDSLAARDEVVVIDVGGRIDVCSLGALLARRAKVRGLAGFVVNGCVRDAAEIRTVGFPLHCVGLSPQKSSVELETASIGEPLVIGGCTIEQGDLVVADDTGVVCVPRAGVEAVLKAARDIEAVEFAVASRIERGSSLMAAFAAER